MGSKAVVFGVTLTWIEVQLALLAVATHCQREDRHVRGSIEACLFQDPSRRYLKCLEQPNRSLAATGRQCVLVGEEQAFPRFARRIGLHDLEQVVNRALELIVIRHWPE